MLRNVFCIGEVLVDLIAENQGKDLSKAAVFVKKAGGASANVACAIAKLGGKSSFVGSVGNDPFGVFLLKVLDEQGVDVSLVQQCSTFTTLAFVSIAEDGERDFVFDRGADKKLTYDSSLKKGFNENLLHLGAATALLGGALEKTYGHYFFDALTSNTFISFDPNYRSDLWQGDETTFIKKCTPYIAKSNLCKFSLEEAQLLSGKKDMYEACTILHEIGASTIAITLGGEGTLISTRKFCEIVPSIKVKPVDTTGAGDAFIGCLLQQISMLHNFDDLSKKKEVLINMVRKANKAGAITTTKFGAIASLPSQNQLKD